MESRKRQIVEVNDHHDDVSYEAEKPPPKSPKHSYKAVPKSLIVESINDVGRKSTTKFNFTPKSASESVKPPDNNPMFNFDPSNIPSTYNTNPFNFPSSFDPFKQTPVIKLSNSSQNTSMPVVCPRFLIPPTDNIAGNVDDSGDSDHDDIIPQDNNDNVIAKDVAIRTQDPYFGESKYSKDIMRDAINKVMNKHINYHLKNSNHIVLRVNERILFEKKVEDDTLTISLNDI